MKVKSINEFRIKEKLEESMLPICKDALALIHAHEQVREVENHTRNQAIKKIKEQDKRIKELESLIGRMMLSMKAHPDYQLNRNGEFIDYVEIAEETLNNKTEKE